MGPAGATVRVAVAFVGLVPCRQLPLKILYSMPEFLHDLGAVGSRPSKGTPFGGLGVHLLIGLNGGSQLFGSAGCRTRPAQTSLAFFAELLRSDGLLHVYAGSPQTAPMFVTWCPRVVGR